MGRLCWFHSHHARKNKFRTTTLAGIQVEGLPDMWRVFRSSPAGESRNPPPQFPNAILKGIGICLPTSTTSLGPGVGYDWGSQSYVRSRRRVSQTIQPVQKGTWVKLRLFPILEGSKNISHLGQRLSVCHQGREIWALNRGAPNPNPCIQTPQIHDKGLKHHPKIAISKIGNERFVFTSHQENRAVSGFGTFSPGETGFPPPDEVHPALRSQLGGEATRARLHKA